MIRQIKYNYSAQKSLIKMGNCFIIQLNTATIPIEVKAEENLQSKSLKTTLAANPGMKGLRFSMSDYREQDAITNVPLYGARAYLAKLLNSQNI